MYDYIEHGHGGHGTPHDPDGTPHSGRHPWGSGDKPFQRPEDFLDLLNKAKKKAMDQKANGATESLQVLTAREMNMTTKEVRDYNSLAKEQQKAEIYRKAVKMREHNGGSPKSIRSIAKKLNVDPHTLTNILNNYEKKKQSSAYRAADVIEKELKKKKYIDVGKGSWLNIGLTVTTMDHALRELKNRGYDIVTIDVPQAMNPKRYTKLKVLCYEPGKSKRDIFKVKGSVKPLGDSYTRDKGHTYDTLEPPVSISSKRIYCNYAETGGKEKDGVIEIRRGVEDLDLGNSKYAQVRIAVDGTNYLKGMAVYSDDIPKGYDIVFNTNKNKDVPLIAKKEGDKEVLKRMKDDPDNPFGALIKDNIKNEEGQFLKGSGQSKYIGKDGKEHLSAINKVKEEGDWTKWSSTIASQFLAKQAPELAKRQLLLSIKDQKANLAEINSIANPVIKKELLMSYADKCDSSAVKLKAAKLPRQEWKAILPVPALGKDQIYAPSFKDGEQVALVRYPHGGIFEIPLLRVNNSNKEAKKFMKNANDAVGISAESASVLSGADFDGDTVLVIPTKESKIKNAPPLEGLKDFDPAMAYPESPGCKPWKKGGKKEHTQMGSISNLITDMTIKHASNDELARAVRHSMVIIDVGKHHYNYKLSYKDNGIGELKKRYQFHPETGRSGGASTLLSKSKGRYDVLDRRDEYNINKETGEKIPILTGKKKKNKKGEWVSVYQQSTKMAETNDARTLSTGTRIEEIYAAYANELKALANQARKETTVLPKWEYSPSAFELYQNEVKSLKSKLNNALKNSPKERQAQIKADEIYRRKLKQHPELNDYDHKDDRKKIKRQAIARARAEVGATARRDRIVKIEPKEWEAIQAGAVRKNFIDELMKQTDIDDLKEWALPKTKGIPAAKKAQIKAYLDADYPASEIAQMVGVSASTVNKIAAE